MNSRMQYPFLLCILILSSIISCTSTGTKDNIKIVYKDYLNQDKNSEEIFRVLLLSDSYLVSQMKLKDKMTRIDDESGDKSACDELKKYDKISEVRDGIISVWLFPDSGKLMKVRPKQLTYLMEIDKLIVEDVQRWNFQFTDKLIDPSQFDIRYKVVLRKKQTDEEIMKEVREKIKEKTVAP
jgi:hypothetical protein